MFVKNVVFWNGIRKILQMNLFLRVRIALAMIVRISMFVLVSVIGGIDIMVIDSRCPEWRAKRWQEYDSCYDCPGCYECAYFGCQYLNGEWTWDEEKQGLGQSIDNYTK